MSEAFTQSIIVDQSTIDLGTFQPGENEATGSFNVTWTGLGTSFFSRFWIFNNSSERIQFSTDNVNFVNTLRMNTQRSSSGAQQVYFKLTKNTAGELSGVNEIFIWSFIAPIPLIQLEGTFYMADSTVSNGRLDRRNRWASGSIPNEYTRVIIKNDVEIREDINPWQMEVASTGNLQLNRGNKITVQDDGYLLIRSGGSFIDLNDTGSTKAIVERYLDSEGGSRGYYLSPPVTAAEINNQSNGINGRSWYWNESGRGWTSLSSGDPIPVMTAFARFSSSSDTIRMKGILNNGQQSVVLTRSSSAKHASPGWNLVGNPYPCAVNWDAASVTKKNLENNTIYYRSKGTFATYNGNTGIGVNGGQAIIPAQQSFWVLVKAGETTGEVGFDKDSKHYAAQDQGRFYRISNPEKSLDYFRFIVSSETKSDEAIIALKEGADVNFDKFDSRKYFASSEPNIYLYTEDEKQVAIDAFSSDEADSVHSIIDVKAGFRTKTKGFYTFTVEEAEHDAKDYYVTIYDKKTKIHHDLRNEKSFSFYSGNTWSAKKDIQDRFEIKIEAIPHSESNQARKVAEKTIDVYSSEKLLYTNGIENSNLEIYTINGVKVFEQKLEGEATVEPHLQDGIYIVKLKDETGIDRSFKLVL